MSYSGRYTEDSNRKRQERWSKYGRGSAAVTKPVQIERIFEMPRAWTFQMPKLRAWVESRIEGDTLNLFGGVTQLSHPSGGMIWYNDINPDISSHFNRDACDLTQWQDSKMTYQTVIFDPPYSDFQAVKTYGIKKAQKVTHARDVVEYILRPGGRVISLGFNSTGMGASRGYQKEAILLVNCGGSHNDYILVSERHNGSGQTPNAAPADEA